jgi:hypothetical protein
MEFIARALERDGFDISTTCWPDVTVLVGEERFTVGIGGVQAVDRIRRTARELRDALAILEPEQPENGRANGVPRILGTFDDGQPLTSVRKAD